MRADHLEVLVEEPSMEAFLNKVLPRMIGDEVTYSIHVHQGKADLLNKIEGRLKGYARWLPDTARIIVLVDGDNDDCRALKARIEAAAAVAGLTTRSVAGNDEWRVVSRIVIEELEAWYFGEWKSVRAVYPKVKGNIPARSSFRGCDEIQGGTWESFQRVLQAAGYFDGGLRKVEAAESIGSEFNFSECNSPSFGIFRDAVLEAIENR